MDPEISIVIPAYNEKGNISSLASTICMELNENGSSYECILVGNGSTDGSNAEIQKLCSENDNFWMITLAKNSSRSAALDAGFKAAEGKYVVMMYENMQDNPINIRRLLDNIDNYVLNIAVVVKGRSPE